MKKASLFFLISISTLFSFAGNNKNTDGFFDDWRKGIYSRRTAVEHLVFINGDAKMILGDNGQLNPFGAGFTASYHYKLSKSRNELTTTSGFGFYSGFITFPGAKQDVDFYNYNSFKYVPLMLSYNFYISSGDANLIIGLDAGANIMIGEKDYKEGNLISYYEGIDNNGFARFIPTVKGYIGYMHELTPDWRFKLQIGVDYNMGYKFDAYTPVYHPYFTNTILEERRGSVNTKALLMPSISIGIGYSL